MHPAVACIMTLALLCVTSIAFFLFMVCVCDIIEAIDAKKLNYTFNYGDPPSLSRAVTKTTLAFLAWFLFMSVLLIGATT